MMKKLNKNTIKMIEKIVQDMTEGNITPLEAVELINSRIGGITRVDYKEGKKFSIANHRDKISVNRNGLNKDQRQLLAELAAIAYLQAQRNGNPRPGEVHLDKGLSSKHYVEQFREYAGGLVAKYSAA